MSAAKWNGLGCAGVGNAGDGTNGGECAISEVAPSFVVRIAGFWEGDGSGNYTIGTKSRIDVQKYAETSKEQARAHEQSEGESNLSSNEEFQRMVRDFLPLVPERLSSRKASLTPILEMPARRKEADEESAINQRQSDGNEPTVEST